MTVAVEVKAFNRIVIVENAESDMHARLAAYYYLYNLLGEQERPSDKELLELTSIWKTSGPVNALIYRNPYK